MQVNEVLSLVLFGALGGMFGQGLRVVVGLKKAQEKAADEGVSFQDDVFDGNRLATSLLIGAIAGVIGVFTLNTLPTFKDRADAVNTFFSLVGIGYAGTDFIEGFIKRYLPAKEPSGEADAGKREEHPGQSSAARSNATGTGEPPASNGSNGLLAARTSPASGAAPRDSFLLPAGTMFAVPAVWIPLASSPAFACACGAACGAEPSVVPSATSPAQEDPIAGTMHQADGGGIRTNSPPTSS